MQFKQHPLYDQAPLPDWISLGSLAESAPHVSSEFHKLFELATMNLGRFTTSALERIQMHAGATYLSERPHPEINDVLWRPTSTTGFQIYVEFFFFHKPDENSPDSDIWWAIINCPNARHISLEAARDFNVTDLGWSVL